MSSALDRLAPDMAILERPWLQWNTAQPRADLSRSGTQREGITQGLNLLLQSCLLMFQIQAALQQAGILTLQGACVALAGIQAGGRPSGLPLHAA
ncbi:MAG: hypothetical protein FRX49_03383 [Trebouxia sp. A1-2]|nr:MAG: hypothetical protein FRX49_03383 [Trebouxia sp. A1-2]